MEDKLTKCPKCSKDPLVVKYEAKYVYSYIMDKDAPGLNNSSELLPFMFDKREQTEARQYVECSVCKAQFPFILNENYKVNFMDLAEAIRD